MGHVDVDSNDPDNDEGVITHLVPDLQSQVGLRVASLRTKLSEVLEFQLSYFNS